MRLFVSLFCLRGVASPRLNTGNSLVWSELTVSLVLLWAQEDEARVHRARKRRHFLRMHGANRHSQLRFAPWDPQLKKNNFKKEQTGLGCGMGSECLMGWEGERGWHFPGCRHCMTATQQPAVVWSHSDIGSRPTWRKERAKYVRWDAHRRRERERERDREREALWKILLWEREREREGGGVGVSEWVSERERERECVCVCVRVCVRACARVHMRVSACGRTRVRVCVCVCNWESERDRQSDKTDTCMHWGEKRSVLLLALTLNVYTVASCFSLNLSRRCGQWMGDAAAY